MRIGKIKIENFKSAFDLEADLTDFTTFIGVNGVGKSTILQAVSKFFEGSIRLSETDFTNRNTDDPIRITLTFVDLGNDELEFFSGKVRNGEMSFAENSFGMSRQKITENTTASRRATPIAMKFGAEWAPRKRNRLTIS